MNLDSSPQPLDFSGVPSLAQLLARQLAEKQLAGGVLAVTDRRGILWQGSVGYADLATARPMEDSTRFWIASMTKAFTSTALMMLWDEGKVSLDDPVANYLPEFRDMWVMKQVEEHRRELERAQSPITVRQVQNHTSGLPFAVPAEMPHFDRLPLDVVVKIYASSPLLSQPGTVYRYSNCGTNTAGRLVEVLSGQRYEDFLRSRILEPLGMEQTTFWPAGEALNQLAKTYLPQEGQLVEQTIDHLSYPLDSPTRNGFPAGGLFSTTRDVATFCRFLLNEGTHQGTRLLSAAAVGQMTSITNGDLNPGYGLGLTVERDGSGKYGHNGALGTSMRFDPAKGLASIWMIQHANLQEALAEGVNGAIASVVEAVGRSLPTPHQGSPG